MTNRVTAPDGTVPSAAANAASTRASEGVPAGSLRHFAVLFSGAAERTAVESLYAFDAEVRRITAAASHEAAHARLQWWRGELDRLAAGRPGHPLAQALLPLSGRRGLDLGQLHELLVAADLDLARMTYRTWDELDAYLSRAAATTQRLIAATLAGARNVTPAEWEFARRLGAATRQVEMLFDLERDLARGRMYAPTEALEAAGIDPPAFARDGHSQQARPFLADWRSRLDRELGALPGILAEPLQRSTQRHGLVLAALHRRWLECWPADASRSPPTASELGPLTRLWTAWRTALRYP